MRKLLLFVCVALTLLSFAGCRMFTETSKPADVSSSITVSRVESSPEILQPEVSKPGVSVPEISVPEVSEPEVSEPEVSEPEISEPEVSEPEESSPIDDGAVYGALDAYGAGTFDSVPKRSSVIYTKVNPVSAIRIGASRDADIAAMYDGTMTRFFSMDGPFITSLSGDYTDSFDEYFYRNGKKEQNIRFEKAADGSYTYERNAAFENNGEDIFVCRSSFDSRIYAFDGQKTMRADGDGIHICYDVTFGTSFALGFTNEGKTCILGSGAVSFDSEPLTVGKMGTVRDGEVLIPFEYDKIVLSDNVIMAQKDGKTYYFNADGDTLGDEEGYTAGSAAIGNRAWVFAGTQGYIIEFK